MENRHEVGVSRKQILILEDENRLLNRLVRLLEELCPGAEIFRTVELEEAYHMAFGKQVELIFIRMHMNCHFDDSRIHFIERIKKNEEFAFVPIILVSTDELNFRYFLGELHCFGIMDPQFDREYAICLIKKALQFRHRIAEKQYAYFKTGGAIKCVRIADILYIEHHKKYAVVYTRLGQFRLTNCSGNSTMQKFEHYDFITCAKGIVVNMRCVAEIDFRKKCLNFKDGQTVVAFGQNYSKKIYSYLDATGVM